MRHLLPVLVACETVLLAALAWLALTRSAPGVEAAAPVSTPKSAEAAPLDTAPVPPALAAAERAPVAASTTGKDQPIGEASIILHGFLTDRAGKPIEGANLYYSRAGGTSRTGSVWRGKPYVIADLPAGRWQLRVRAEGHRTVESEVDVPAFPRVQRVDHVLDELVVLTVRLLTPEGKPLLPGLSRESWQAGRCLLAIATAEAPAAVLPQTTSALLDYGVGRWRPREERPMRNQPALPPDIAGLLELDEPLPLYVSLALRNHVIDGQLVAPGSKEVTFTLPMDRLTGMLGSLRVRVIDATTRQPLKGARVSATDRQHGSSGIEVDAEGVCVLEKLQPGLLELEIYAADRERFSRWIQIEPGQRLEAGTVEMGPARQISGRVLGGDGKSATGVEVRVACLRLEGYDPKLDARPFDRACDAKGEFKLERLGRGRYLVYATVKQARHGWQVVDTTGSDVTGVELRLGAVHAVTLRCATRSSEPLSLTVYDEKQQPIAGRRVSAKSPWSVDLPAGRYVLEVWDDHRRRASVPFTVESGAVEVRYQP